MKGKFRLMWRVAVALVLVVSFSLVMAVPASAVGTLTGVTATLGTTITGATTDYTIGFTTATDPCEIKTVDMTFDAAFNVSGATLGVVTGGATPGQGFDAGTLSIDGQTVTYTVTSTEEFSGLTPITIQLNGIVNPAAGTYVSAITIMTKAAGPVILDTGSASVIIAPVPESFKVVTEHSGTEAAGTAFHVTVTALKADGVITETGYAGAHLISFTSTASDPKTIPTFEMLTFSNGVQTTSESFVLNVVETGETITATDAALGITGPSSAITVTVGALYGLVITGAPTAAVTAGEAFSGDITVTAEDAYGNAITTGDQSTSTITWSGGGTDAVLPAAHPLVAGTWTFSGSDFTLKESGAQTITATKGDTAARATAYITVSPAAASKLSLAAAVPDTIEANGYASSTITATVQDAYSNTVTTSTATITFETSLGQFANGASIYSVAFAYHGYPYYAYWARATLTSTAEGTATVKVTSGTLTYATTPVTVDTVVLPSEVWVDDTNGDNTHLGTEADPFKTIQHGIDHVAVGGTVNVAAGTYTTGSMLTINVEGLTLKGANAGVSPVTGTRGAESIIDSTAEPIIVALEADNVTIDGFTIQGDSSHDQQGIARSPTGFIIKNNKFSGIKGGATINLETSGGAITSGTIDNNTFVGPGESSADAIILSAASANNMSDVTISNNEISNYDGDSGVNIAAADGKTASNIAITGNTVTDCANGVRISCGAAGGGEGTGIMDSMNIANNTFDACKRGIRVYARVTNLTITGNDIINGLSAGGGVVIEVDADGVYWAATDVIHNNNIYGNVAYGIDNKDTAIIDAENNWWGDATGPYHSANTSGTGDEIEGLVDYRPWLTSEYGVAAVTSVSLSTGWNLISLPLYIPPANQAPATLLAGVTGVDIVWGDYDPDDNSWNTYDPDKGENDLLAMSDGKGYWVDMTAADTLDVSALGTELPVAPAAPPTYDVVVGWNLIGFKSTTPTTASTYLAALGTNYTMIYGFANGVYSAVQSTDSLEPGYGYWIAVTAVGTIYP